MRGDIGPTENARTRAQFLLMAAPFAEGEQPAEAGPGGAVGGVDEEGGRIGEGEPAAGDEAEAGFAAALEGAHHAGDGIAVGDADGGVAEVGGGFDQLLDVARAPQEAVVGGDLKLRVRHGRSLGRCGPGIDDGDAAAREVGRVAGGDRARAPCPGDGRNL